ncbi:hypothetical protein BD408DRAFT_401341 [Parasitella parasitica]|nr:hypothetical protein BD408DRAFT_401341 [Parasitella parasitica]
MATIGDIPPARYSFSTVNGLDGKSIVLFGGQNATDTQGFDATNDVYVLDTCTLKWSRPVISGEPPVARAGHEAIVYGDQYMIVVMGIQNYDSLAGPIYTDETAILDMKSWTWITYNDTIGRWDYVWYPWVPTIVYGCRYIHNEN